MTDSHSSIIKGLIATFPLLYMMKCYDHTAGHYHLFLATLPLKSNMYMENSDSHNHEVLKEKDVLAVEL